MFTAKNLESFEGNFVILFFKREEINDYILKIPPNSSVNWKSDTYELTLTGEASYITGYGSFTFYVGGINPQNRLAWELPYNDIDVVRDSGGKTIWRNWNDKDGKRR